MDAKIAAEEARLAALDDLFASLLQQLMTGKVRVKGEVDGGGVFEYTGM